MYAANGKHVERESKSVVHIYIVYSNIRHYMLVLASRRSHHIVYIAYILKISATNTLTITRLNCE